MPSPPACRRMRLYRRRAHLLAAQGGMTYTPPSIYEIRRNSNDFSEKFSCWEHEFFEYFAWRKYWGAEGSQSRSGFFDSGSVAASGKSGSKNRIVSEDETVSRKSGSSGKSGDGGEAGWIRKSKRRRGTLLGPPSAFTEREMRYFKGPCRRRGLAAEGATPPRGYAAKGLRRQGATPPRGYAAEGLCYQGALPPRGCAAKGLCRQGLLSPKRSAAKGGIRPGASYRPPERLRPERPRS